METKLTPDISVFEPGEDEKNEEEYKKIHDDYRNVVGFRTDICLKRSIGTVMNVFVPLNIIGMWQYFVSRVT